MNEVLERAVAAERAARRQLETVPDWLWDGESLPVPIETIADSHYGLLVREAEELAEVAGMAGEYVSGLLFPGPREIWVDAEESARAPGRRRFTIGHELGHWVLHCSAGDEGVEVVHCRAEVVQEEAAVEEDHGHSHIPEVFAYPPRELDANQFAAAMLMPEGMVRAAHRRVGDDLRALAKEFGVSPIAMERRLWFLAHLH